jgi:hypothetical protein
MSPEELHNVLDGPALARPHGVAPGPLNQGNHAIGYALVILPALLCTVAVAARLASRFALKRVGIEDVLIVCALVRLSSHFACIRG